MAALAVWTRASEAVSARTEAVRSGVKSHAVAAALSDVDDVVAALLANLGCVGWCSRCCDGDSMLCRVEPGGYVLWDE